MDESSAKPKAAIDTARSSGLFMCGEVLDVDGVTGGFNFMGCWSSGYVAGEGAAKFCLDDQMKMSSGKTTLSK